MPRWSPPASRHITQEGNRRHGSENEDGVPKIFEIGTFSDVLIAKAKQQGWVVISRKTDWKRIFAFE